MNVFETVHGIFLDDLDAIGVLHNSRYLFMFERALGAFWRNMGWTGILDYESNPDALQVVRENQVEYLRPAVGADEVRVRTWIACVGGSSLTFRFAMLDAAGVVVLAVGKRVMVKIDPVTRKPAQFSSAFREMIRPWVESTAPVARHDRATTPVMHEESAAIQRFRVQSICPTVS